ncbi:hypothetical protein JD844_022663 [Phrynosoma platyrhinos]|uniref:Glycerol-3-phosphate dehydrogenase n=1 Tax=Phrynosoma platyrhinos TaxID=52577 RepID=A0ABQ7SVN6_PHRPL|nr:hypothetical protein JD844_022663 [Phrynosoma platyrhinos]
MQRSLPSREHQLQALRQTSEFDILVIGGGATGSGCALDAVSRGLKTALVERDDFSSGTSSRSTKLIHGGVRYLQKAIMKLDFDQNPVIYEEVRLLCPPRQVAENTEVIQRSVVQHKQKLQGSVVQHDQKQPSELWWQLPYYWVGIKLYDLVAGSQCLKSSYVLSKSKALELFPMLQKDKLVGAIVYYDGQHNDARMNLAIALTAARYGAAIANYTEVMHLLKKTDPNNGKSRVYGARCRDVLSGQEFDVKAKCVINATGPFTDSVRKMDDQEVPNICQPSAGVHIVMPGYYSPDNMGLLDPSTSDGRVIFFLPWQKMTIAGTTDTATEITSHPIPTEEDINFILTEVRNYLSCDVEGGKWTTYRSMAQDTIDAAVKAHGLHAGPCKTVGLLLQGAEGWSPTLYIRLVQDYGMESEVAQHLASTFGDKAFEVAKLAQVTGKRWPIVGKRLVSEFPYIESEIEYGIQEYACTAVDMIARRTRLAFLNVQAADEALPRIIEIMGEKLKWSEQKKKEELAEAKKFLYYEMGYKARSEQLTDRSEITLSPTDIERYKKRFYMFDKEGKGFITVLDVQHVLESINFQINESALHEILNEVDLNKNGQVELNEFLQLMTAIQKGSVSGSRLAVLMKAAEENISRRDVISVDRSGGGLISDRKHLE